MYYSSPEFANLLESANRKMEQASASDVPSDAEAMAQALGECMVNRWRPKPRRFRNRGHVVPPETCFDMDLDGR
jgi:hypothetical protein